MLFSRAARVGQILFLTVITALPAFAQTDSINFRMILSVSPVATVHLDERYEEANNRLLPLHLSMPVAEPAEQVALRTRFMDQGLWGEFVYFTQDGRLLEYITLSHATIDDGTQDDRLQAIYMVMENQVYPTLNPPDDADILGGRIVSIGDYPAVEFISVFDNPDQGMMTARIVGVIPPAGSDVLIFVQLTVLERMRITDVNELVATFGGRMLSGLAFSAWRDAQGVVQGF